MKNLRNILMVLMMTVSLLVMNSTAFAGLLVSDLVGTDSTSIPCTDTKGSESNLDGGILVTLTGILVTLVGGDADSKSGTGENCAIIVHD